MDLLIQIILGLVIFTSIFLSAIVLLSSRLKNYHYYFSIFVFFIALWALGAGITTYSNSPDIALFGYYLFDFAPLITVVFIPLFCISYPDSKKSVRNAAIFFSSFAILGFIQHLAIGLDDIVTINPNGRNFFNVPQSVFYDLFFVLAFAFSYYVMIKKFFTFEGVAKKQIGLSLTGLILGGLPALLTNLLLPNLGFEDTSWIGPGFSLFFTGLTAYAMVRHKLFNIKPIVFRSLLYALLLLVLSVLHFAAATWILRGPLGISLSYEFALLFTIVTLTLLATFVQLKSIIDTATQSFFYNTSFSNQKELASYVKLNSNALNSQEIVDNTLETLNALFKPNEVNFVDGSYFTYFEIMHYEDVPEKTRKEIGELDNPELIVPVGSSFYKVGAIVLGPKKSGQRYTRKDMRFITNIANAFALAMQNLELEQVNQSQDDLMRIAKHQLKNPISTTEQSLELIDEHFIKANPKEALELIKIAKTSTKRTEELVTEMLEVTRTNLGTFKIAKKPADVKALVKERVEVAKTSAREKSIKISIRFKKSLPTKVNLDEAAIREVVANFLDNAIKYTQENGKIDVSATSRKDRIELRITDNGQGVPKKDQSKIFDKFARASNTQNAEGTGLGLYFVKQIVDLHDGEIIFESIEDKGSTFGFRLPK